MGLEHNQVVGILASGGGSTAEAFIEAIQEGVVQAEVAVVVCNKPPDHPEAGVYARIAAINSKYNLDIQMVNIGPNTHPDRPTDRGQTLDESEAIYELFTELGVTHTSLQGYMRKVNGALFEKYGWKPHYTSIYEASASNTHPGPLPLTADTFGIHASEKVLDSGLIVSAHTLQLLGEEIDEGPTLAAHPVTVFPGDTAQTLFERVQGVEKRALPIALNKFLREQRKYFAAGMDKQ